MSFACVFLMIRLGSSVAMAFVLQPSQEEWDRSADFKGSPESVSLLKSIKEDLLMSLNLQAEPQVPVGLLDIVQERWNKAFNKVSNETIGCEASVSDGGNLSDILTCCSMTSEIFMKDLGWDNWVIHPHSLKITKCELCTKEGNTVQCTSPPHPQNGQVPCCRPTSHKMVSIVYMNDFGDVVISSVQLTRGCGCDTGNNQQPINL